jgi:uncharacterized membrane protein (DUF2068 family)
MARSSLKRELPGTTQPRRFIPRFHYELLVCGVRGHELIGTEAAELRPEDASIARPGEPGERWYRCVRCDSWLPLSIPATPGRRYPPAREEVKLPLRGRPLRDKIVLRVIAVDRALHFVILAIVAAAIFVFAANQARLRGPAYRVLADLQGGVTGPSPGNQHGFVDELRHLFSVQSGTLTKIGVVVAAYALLEGTEAVGLWFQRRWAEYLTFVATAALLPLEVYELARSQSPLKLVTLLINLAIVVYLLLAKRLFGLRGGVRAEEAVRARDSGWSAIERNTPGRFPRAPTVQARGEQPS